MAFYIILLFEFFLILSQYDTRASIIFAYLRVVLFKMVSVL